MGIVAFVEDAGVMLTRPDKTCLPRGRLRILPF
jgi:hypothetical protein